jgi:Ca2+-binding EF-hand superfamily protein
LKKIIIILIVGVFITSVISLSTFSDQYVDAGSTKKVHFTQTITSSQDPGLGHENHQLAFILSPNEGTIYDGSMTFTSSESVKVVVLHEISHNDVKGQDVWNVNEGTIYGLSLIDPEKKSGSFEFTGAGVALHSTNSKEFTTTVSVDGWIRGQPTQVLAQKLEFEKEDPSLLLSRANVPVTIPMHKGIHNENKILYIITDASDKNYVNTISEKQEWNIQLSKSIKDIPENNFQKIFIFKNGIKGDGIFGFQNEIFSSTPAQSDYTALGSIIEVTWKPGQKEITFQSTFDVIDAEKSGRIKFNETNVIVNVPQIKWLDDQMTIRSDKQINNKMLFSGGQIIEINEDELFVTFVAHRSWDSDGKTIYYIVTDATPIGPAELMGAVYSPTLSNLLTHSSVTDLFQFKNGIKGSGSLGYQPEILNFSSNEEDYSPISKIYLIEWHNSKLAQILQTKSDIDSFDNNDLLTVSIARPTNSEYIINSPIIDPFQ